MLFKLPDHSNGQGAFFIAFKNQGETLNLRQPASAISVDTFRPLRVLQSQV